MTDLPPLTRYAALAASARAGVRPHRIAQPPVQAAELAHRLLHAPADERRKELDEPDDRALLDVLVVMELHTGSAYELWRDTPSGFAEDVLGMPLTVEQRAVLDAVAGAHLRGPDPARDPDPDRRADRPRAVQPEQHVRSRMLGRLRRCRRHVGPVARQLDTPPRPARHLT
jgi:hypothetical protein